MRWSLSFVLLLAACTEPVAPPSPPPGDPGSPGDPQPRLAPSQAEILKTWYDAVGEKRPDESFGALVDRVAVVRLGNRHYAPPRTFSSHEKVSVRLESFNCVSFVQYVLAVARCTWRGTPSDHCFVDEVASLRYRAPEVSYQNRLHYFSDWLFDNARRGQLTLVAKSLGGHPRQKPFNYLSTHPEQYPALALPENRAAIAKEEARLSQTVFYVVGREEVASIEKKLEPGDIIGIVDQKPGIFLTHAGFAHRDKKGRVHLLHSSSYHEKILVDPARLSGYVTRQPNRLGIMVGRPSPPFKVEQR